MLVSILIAGAVRLPALLVELNWLNSTAEQAEMVDRLGVGERPAGLQIG
jgi:hypothetical protein